MPRRKLVQPGAAEPSAPPIRAEMQSVAEFAFHNGISRSLTYQLIEAGKLIAKKLGDRTLITREDAERWRASLPSYDPALSRSRGRPRKAA